MTQEQINLIEDLIYTTIEYKFAEISPTKKLWEIANDIDKIKKQLKETA